MVQSVGILSLIFVTTLMLLATGCAQKTTPASTTQMSASGPTAEEIRAREEEERRDALPRANWRHVRPRCPQAHWSWTPSILSSIRRR